MTSGVCLTRKYASTQLQYKVAQTQTLFANCVIDFSLRLSPRCTFICNLLFRSLSSTQTHTNDFYRYLQRGSVHGSLLKIHVYVNAHTCTYVYTQYMYIYIWIYMYTYIFSKMNQKRQSNVHRKNRNISLSHTNTHITGEVCE